MMISRRPSHLVDGAPPWVVGCDCSVWIGRRATNGLLSARQVELPSVAPKHRAPVLEVDLLKQLETVLLAESVRRSIAHRRERVDDRKAPLVGCPVEDRAERPAGDALPLKALQNHPARLVDRLVAPARRPDPNRTDGLVSQDDLEEPLATGHRRQPPLVDPGQVIRRDWTAEVLHQLRIALELLQ